MEKIREIVEKIVKQGISQFLWDWSFDLISVASRLEFRAIKGKDIWTAELLEIVLVPYREHVRRQGLNEAQVDQDLRVLAEKIDLPIDMIRKQFYAFEFGEPSKEQPKASQKVETSKSETAQASTEKEEIVLEGDEKE
jgi:hypothetical protein